MSSSRAAPTISKVRYDRLDTVTGDNTMTTFRPARA